MNPEIILALKNIKGIGPVNLKKLVYKLSTSYSDYESIVNYLSGNPKIPSKSEWMQLIDNSNRAINLAKESGIEIITIFDEHYPYLLKDSSSAPCLIFLKGDIEKIKKPKVSIIGTRKPSFIGIKASERISEFMALNGVSIVNGLADGVDWAAAAINLNTLENTTAIAACGLDFTEQRIASKSFEDKARKLLDAGGLLISEYPPGKKEDQYSIIESCKIQASISDSMVMIQSGIKGGTRFAVKEFLALQRDFYYLIPPAKEKDVPEFQTNSDIRNRGNDALSEFTGINSNKISSKIYAIESRSDYPKIVERIKNRTACLKKNLI